ncbi:hypothetical protein [Tengunoibacter tsumagoiensis]|uniref:Uncharacterized protein n=1 Tax=Tengunoibacter tsumagoiensis TaxID=2014871 RepID=A0A401ZV00_9CHLR|nr:hypothetical protein [Tengunoibacter tsumagoiensis]GCE10560.1 hypothetical protein KTT_04190 [Tengunoibacter tsumagoiensis]
MAKSKAKPSQTQQKKSAPIVQQKKQDPIVQQQPQIQQQQQAPVVAPATGALTQLTAHFPEWPTSKPGPRSTPPPPGMAPSGARRPEQVVELGYNQVSGEPGSDSPFRSLPDAHTSGPTSSDLLTAQEALGKRKQRL